VTAIRPKYFAAGKCLLAGGGQQEAGAASEGQEEISGMADVDAVFGRRIRRSAAK
jgi:hypothetical protein